MSLHSNRVREEAVWDVEAGRRQMRRVVPALVVCGMALLCAAARGDDWRQWGHDQRRTQFSRDRIKLPLTELRSWTPLTGSSPLYGAAIAGGRIYYITRTGTTAFGRAAVQRNGKALGADRATRTLVCANAKTGSVIWAQPLSAIRLASPLSDAVAPVVDGGRVFVYDSIKVLHLSEVMVQGGGQRAPCPTRISSRWCRAWGKRTPVPLQS